MEIIFFHSKSQRRNVGFLLFFPVLFLACYREPVTIIEGVEVPLTPDILSHEKIDSVIDGFEKIKFFELDTAYISYSDPLDKFEKKLKKLEYSIVKGRDVFKKIVGPFRVMHFLSHDKYYSANLNNVDANLEQYWLVDKKMLHMLLDLILELERLGYDKYGFMVRCGHRNPRCNIASKGSGQSQHQFGRAADLEIKDINKDGKSTDEDKQIVLEILEKIVDDDGGLGLYPGTMSVHLDSRGHRARWNSYKSPY